MHDFMTGEKYEKWKAEKARAIITKPEKEAAPQQEP
jgi:hypothetical protein